MLDGGRNTILLPPFGGLSGEVPRLLPFLCLRFERLVLVRVDGGGISDGLGSDRDGDLCVGNGGCNSLSYGSDKAPEDIGSYGRSCRIFISVAFISSRPHCHCLLGRSTDGSDKLG